MNLNIMISLRNLMRQKRRNILLGSAIAFGVMILVIATSFSTGVTDILFNKIAKYVAGHVSIVFNEKSVNLREVFRDKERLYKIINPIAGDNREVEENIGIFTRAIGNGKADNMILVGIDMTTKISDESRTEIEKSFRMIEGSFNDLKRDDVENPLIISADKAKALNVKVGEIVKVRYDNLFGNKESARLTVVGILQNDNMFMQAVMFVELKHLKRFRGYRANETASLSFTVNNPQENAVKLADKLHSALKPGIAGIYGTVIFNGESPATVLGYKTDDDSKKIVSESIKITDGDKDKIFTSKAVLVSKSLAEKLGIKAEDKIEFTHKPKFEEKPAKNKYTVTAVFDSQDMHSKDVVFINEERFYDTYYDNLPPEINKIAEGFIPDKNSSIYSVLATEWILLPRTGTTEEFQKKLKDINKKKWKATTVDVRTMYETASDALNLEAVLNLITFSAVLVLLFITLIGVINTLRMTIRERTREIGTIRAIGMQKNDVRNSFILESFFLALFASIIGVILSFITMYLLSQITFNMPDNPMSILLIDQHLYFIPTFTGIISNIALILLIVVSTAFFPAKRASNLSPANALRHFE